MNNVHHDVLVVDDETALAQASVEYLQAFGISATAVDSAEAARQHLADGNTCSLVLLDVNLPGMNGFTFCRDLRARARTPIVFISARGGEDDQILALSIGGDDYLTKPFSLALLKAKVERMLARASDSEPTPATTDGYRDDWLHVDAATGRTWVGGKEVQLKAMEDKLLRHLVAHRGRVVTKAELFDHVWQDTFVGDGTLSVHVRRLRSKIEPDPDHPIYLRTVWGRGYLFEGRDTDWCRP